MAVTDQQWKTFARKYVNTGRFIYGETVQKTLASAHRLWGKRLTFHSGDFEAALKAHNIKPRPDSSGDGYILELKT
jgi:hypothetical protein